MGKRKILIIEDNSDIRESTAEILELTGEYTVLVAEEGKTGVDDGHEAPSRSDSL